MLNLFSKQTNSAIGQNGHTPTHLIDIHNVVKTYHTPAGDFPALVGIDLKVDKGEFVSVVGKSGSGKSTLINMITGIDRPTSGSIYVGDQAIHGLGEGSMAEWRGRNVGVIFQFFQLLPMLSCVENIMLPMDFRNMYPPKRTQRTSARSARSSGDGRPRLQTALRSFRRSAAACGHCPSLSQRPTHPHGR